MDTELKDRIRERLNELGKTARAASIEAGLHPDTIRNVLRERSKKPRGDSLLKLARALDVTVEWLMEGTPPPQSAFASADLTPQPASFLPEAATKMPRNIPILGTAAGSLVGAFQVDCSTPIDYVRRPPGLEGARDIYALYVVGNSMSPRFEEGELIYVSERRPARIGDYVVVQTKDALDGSISAYCKRLRKRTTDFILVEQYNPATSFTLPTSEIKAIHRVLTMNELFGA